MLIYDLVVIPISVQNVTTAFLEVEGAILKVSVDCVQECVNVCAVCKIASQEPYMSHLSVTR